MAVTISEVTRKRNEILSSITAEDFKHLESDAQPGEEYPQSLVDAVQKHYGCVLDFLSQAAIMDGFDMGVKYMLEKQEKENKG